MSMLSFFPILGPWTAGLVDSTFLVLLLSPPIYLLLLRPLASAIKEREKAGEELRRLNESLEQRVEEKTREIRGANERLALSEKLSAMGRLAASVSHDLRNPLGVMENSVYYLKSEFRDADERLKKHLDILHREAKKAVEIIDELLDPFMEKPLHPAKADCNKVIREALASAQIPRNIIVEEQLDQDLPEIFIDRGRMSRVFLNLISNAVQAMKGGGKLRIAAGVKDGFVEVVFKDSGTGIPGENREKIFEPLFTTRPEGSGLGLLIVKNIIEGHKGRIEVESEAGKGAEFTIVLPLKETDGREA